MGVREKCLVFVVDFKLFDGCLMEKLGCRGILREGKMWVLNKEGKIFF